MIDLSNIDLLILGACAVVVGMYFLVKGGDYTVDAAVYTARHMGISPIVVGFTIVAFGTSFPELLASMAANLKGAPGITIGNVLGSNVANIFMVAGATAILIPLAAQPKILKYDIVIMLIATAVLTGLMFGDVITRWQGLALFGGLLVYTFFKYKAALAGKVQVDEIEEPEFKSLRTAIKFLFLGLVIISVGADFLIRGSTLIASILGVPDLVIGLSIIAIGTSLPELSTCLAAARKGHTDVVIGNVIGSNIFNILMIIGLCAFAKPLVMEQIDARAVQIDIWVTIAVTLLFSIWIYLFKGVSRNVGIAFVVLYFVYIGLQYTSVVALNL